MSYDTKHYSYVNGQVLFFDVNDIGVREQCEIKDILQEESN